MAVLPAIAMLPTYGSYRNALDRIEAVRLFHENFWASECELDVVANRVDSGERLISPVRAGLFQIVRGERLEDGTIVLYTKDDGILDARWGFVRNQEQTADGGPATLVGMKGELGEAHCVQRLSGRWFALYHHYWFIKRGWS